MIGWCLVCGKKFQTPKGMQWHNKKCAPDRRPWCEYHNSHECRCPYLTSTMLSLYRRKRPA